jgi:hypothetical protein
MSLSFTISAGPYSGVILGSESHGTHDHILPSQIRDSPKLEDQVPVFITLTNRVVRLYTQALGVSYDSQGYGGSIQPRLHTGWNKPWNFRGNINPMSLSDKKVLLTWVPLGNFESCLFESKRETFQK